MRVLSYGGGTNSTALLVGLHEKGLNPDLILFADTGSEKPHTYDHVKVVNEWCLSVGFPEIITVKGSQPQQLKDGSLYNECLRLGVLPSRVYGRGSCSMKWKKDPQDKYLRNNEQCLKVWDSGEKVTKLIGYEWGEERRADREAFITDKLFSYQFPLIDWGWDREECIAAIKRAGLPQPGKSACFFCPSSKKSEIFELQAQYPELALKAIELEENAAETNVVISGLGRHWSWGDLLKQDDFLGFPENYLDRACGCYDG